MKSKEKFDIDVYCKKMESHIDKTKENMRYAIDRFDILIISISSGGLVFSMGFVKDLIQKNENVCKCCQNSVDLTLVKISWVLLALAILSNLFSQLSSYYASSREVKICQNLLRKKENKSYSPIEKIEGRKRFLDFLTKLLNWISLISLCFAVILLFIFMSNNF